MELSAFEVGDAVAGDLDVRPVELLFFLGGHF
jgi:hypothetical protein